MKKAVHVFTHTTLKGSVSVSLKALRQYVCLIFEDWTAGRPFMVLAGDVPRMIESFSPVKINVSEKNKEKLSITLEVIVQNGVPIHSQCRKLQRFMADQLRELTCVSIEEVNIRVVSCKVDMLQPAD
ncbi:Asp23/Gls24 family envelope stress response protein [Alteribacter lacisalsi]|nr:Asp23/Gls24 family envelope stress response protein [Alteribacter lacisalsi]